METDPNESQVDDPTEGGDGDEESGGETGGDFGGGGESGDESAGESEAPSGP